MSYLHVRLVEAVGLPSTDIHGFADPYCKVHLKNVSHLSENKIFKSEAKKKSIDPIFDCAASLNVSGKDLEAGMLVIDIFDHDKAKKTDDEMGSAQLPLSYFKDTNQFHGWLPIRSQQFNNPSSNHSNKAAASRSGHNTPLIKAQLPPNTNPNYIANPASISPMAISESATANAYANAATSPELHSATRKSPATHAYRKRVASNGNPPAFSLQQAGRSQSAPYEAEDDLKEDDDVQQHRHQKKSPSLISGLGNKLRQKLGKKKNGSSSARSSIVAIPETNTSPHSLPLSPPDTEAVAANGARQLRFAEEQHISEYAVDSLQHPDGTLDPAHSLHANLSVRVGSFGLDDDPPHPIKAVSSIDPDEAHIAKEFNQLNEVAESQKKKLASVTEQFMKAREEKLQLSRNQTLANLGIQEPVEEMMDENDHEMIQRGDEETLYDLVTEQECKLPDNDTALNPNGSGSTLQATPTKSPQQQKSQPHGKRNRDSGRIYIVVYYQKQFHFGKMSNEEVKKTRTRHLRVFNQFEQNMPITVFTLTFNAGNCSLAELNAAWPQFIPNDNNIDLYALAFQELNQSKEDKKNHKRGSSKMTGNESLNQPVPLTEQEEDDEESKKQDAAFEKGDNQQTAVIHSLLSHIGDTYVSIAHYKMWQIRLFLFTRKEFAERISNVTAHYHTTGIGGVVKNKGAVAISLEFDGLSLCFVSCHLAAHQTKVDQRNAMYKKLCKNIRVGWRKQQLLGQFHFLFFMGDMNYRVNYFGREQPDKPNDDLFQNVCSIIKQITINSVRSASNRTLPMDVKNKVTGGGQLKQADTPYAGLLKFDQLTISRDQHKAFVGFHEHHIKFPPSFKVKRQNGIHYIAQRLPAWCDRILWRCPRSFDEQRQYAVKTYRCYDKVSVSDHKPVSCTFILPTWNRPVGISDACTKAILHFRKMSAQNLIPADVNGKSDPFIHFPRQLVLEKYVQSKRVNKTLNPKWKDKHLKPLVMIRNSLPFLQRALLLFQIRDHDTFSANDLIGCGYIELKYCVEKLNKWIPFNELLTLDGKDAGVFMGEVKLEYKVKKSKKGDDDDDYED